MTKTVSEKESILKYKVVCDGRGEGSMDLLPSRGQILKVLWDTCGFHVKSGVGVL